MKLLNLAILIVFILLMQCNSENELPMYDKTPYSIQFGNLPIPDFPQDNIPTNTGVALGKRLFFDPILSRDLTQSCASCHNQKTGFSDSSTFSIGIRKLPGKRQAMAIFNLAYHDSGFFWDGRASSLRDQALRPIQDPLEMDDNLDNVVKKLDADQSYKDDFIRAFGSDSINPKKISFALEQFMLVIFSGKSRFDLVEQGKAQFSESELRGKDLFFNETDQANGIVGAECFHCHGGFNFTNNQFMNNGLDTDSKFKDLGRYDVTKGNSDKAKFKVPSLRNIEFTAPYMHDGRFNTLEEVIEHYNSGVKMSSTVDGSLHTNLSTGLKLNSLQKIDLINFLKTLSDSDFIKSKEFQK